MMKNKHDEIQKDVVNVCRSMYYYMRENFAAVTMVDLVGKASGGSGRRKSSRKGLNKTNQQQKTKSKKSQKQKNIIH